MTFMETLNFGPEWLRALSGENQVTSPPPIKNSLPTKSTKFKLAQYRYGREEMLALFTKSNEMPDELLQVPSIINEEGLLPLSLIPMTEDEQRASTNVNSNVSYRGRGGGVVSGRGRSAPARGRGRGRGEGYMRAVSHDEDAGYSSRWDYTRNDGWEGRKGGRDGGGYEDVRKPRRVNSEDWRSDSSRGKGDGAEDSNGASKEWKTAGSRRDAWRGDGWRSRDFDAKEKKSKPPKEEFSAVPEWAEDSKEEIGQFDEQGTYRIRKLSSSDADTNWRNKTERVEESKGEEGSKEKKMSTSSESSDNNRTSSEVIHEESPPPEVQKNEEERVKESQTPDPVVPTSSTASQNPIVTEQDTLSQLEETSMTVVNSISEMISDVAETPPGQTTVTRPSPVPTKHWLYKDPQGDIQGPFSSSEMMEWFTAGYFQVDLLVRRISDPQFIPLGEVISRSGSIPFMEKRASPVSLSDPVVPDQQPTSSQQFQFHKMLQEHENKVRLQQQQERQQKEEAALKTLLTNLQQNEQFRMLPPQQQQMVQMNYVRKFQEQQREKQQMQANAINVQVPSSTEASNNMQILMEKLKRSAEVKKRQEDEMRRKLQEQEHQRQEELRMLRMQEQQMNELRRSEENLRKQQEMLAHREEELRRIQMEAKRKQDELEAKRMLQEKMQKEERQKQLEIERKRKHLEEEAKRQEEQRRMLEEVQKRQMEEERRKAEELRRLQEEEHERMEKMRILEEERRIAELKMREDMERQREKERIKHEEMKRIELEKKQATLKEKEIKRQREIENSRLKEAEAKQREAAKRQQEAHLQNMKLPSHAMWGASSSNDGRQERALSLLEIQQLEQRNEAERRRKEEQMRMLHLASQPAPVKSGWGGNPLKPTKTLLQIQQEEALKQQKMKKANNNTVTHATTSDPSWSKQAAPSGQWAAVANKNASSMFWDQVVEEKPVHATPKKNNNQNKNNPKQKNTPKCVPAAQPVVPKKEPVNGEKMFNEWCNNYLNKLNLSTGIDIPTFVGFLRDVESPYEVREYVCSCLGESKEANEFAKTFIEKRKNIFSNNEPTNTTKSNVKVDTDGFEMVQSNAKRGKKKQKKQQKVDPSLLGFSVNAASDRVNMGEIQSAKDL